MRRSRIGTALGGVLVVLASMGLLGCDPDSDTDPKPPGQPMELSVLHYNVHQGHSDPVIDVLAKNITNTKPDVVTLNELCQADYSDSKSVHDLLPKLEKVGYTGRFVTSKRTALTCSPDAVQGVAVFVKTGSASHSVIDIEVGQGTPCLKVEAETPFAACATHLTAPHRDDDPPDRVTVDEAYELRSRMKELSARMPVIFAGDLNLDPWHRAIEDLHEDFYGLDENEETCGGEGERPKDPDNPPASCTFWHEKSKYWKKLDYIFVDKAHFSSKVDANVIDVNECVTVAPEPEEREKACSDHQQVRGTAQLIDPDSAPETAEPSSPGPSATEETKEGPGETASAEPTESTSQGPPATGATTSAPAG